MLTPTPAAALPRGGDPARARSSRDGSSRAGLPGDDSSTDPSTAPPGFAALLAGAVGAVAAAAVHAGGTGAAALPQSAPSTAHPSTAHPSTAHPTTERAVSGGKIAPHGASLLADVRTGTHAMSVGPTRPLCTAPLGAGTRSGPARPQSAAGEPHATAGPIPGRSAARGSHAAMPNPTSAADAAIPVVRNSPPTASRPTSVETAVPAGAPTPAPSTPSAPTPATLALPVSAPLTGDNSADRSRAAATTAAATASSPLQFAPQPAPPAALGQPAPSTAAGPPPQPQLAAAFGQFRAHADGSYQLNVQLHPAELGAVQVQATVDHDTLTVTVACADHAARAAVQTALPQLHNQLRAAGFGALDVNVGGQTPQQQPSARADPPRRTPPASTALRVTPAGRSGPAPVRQRRPATDLNLDRWL